MNFENISKQGKLKGLHLIGTGDALHPLWIKEIKLLAASSDGIYEKNGCKFIATAEVEDSRRVHHLILLPDISSAESLRGMLKKFSVDIDRDGRPHLSINGEELVDFVEEAGGLIGPSHAFVPWTSIYKEHNSLNECYGENARKIKFLELGLSADTFLADYIDELRDLTFLSNSDAHSPWPHRLGREFNRLNVSGVTFKDIRKALERADGNKIELNVGLDPRLGKYHRTACVKCFRIYSLDEAAKIKWRCTECRGLIKKGVSDRIMELSVSKKSMSPMHRPKYIRVAPLAEILSFALKTSNIYSPKIQDAWKKLVTEFGSEISVLLDTPVGDVERLSDERTAKFISAFREGKFDVAEGGGGKYGEILFENNKNKKSQPKKQTLLDSF